MSILLTGATGYIGSSVLPALIARGHEVTALVRTPDAATMVEAAGATVVIGTADDPVLVAELARRSDGVIHVASSPAVDEVLVPAVLAAIAGSGTRFVHTGGIWIYGSGDDLTEDSPFQPLPISGWRADGQRLVLAAPNTVVITPAVVHGHGTGMIRGLVDAPRGDGTAPAVPLIGDGSQHWTSVHVDDLAALYVLAYERPEARGVYIGASGENPTVRELGEAIAEAWHVVGGVAPETIEKARERLGRDYADAVLLDQSAFGSRARSELGWQPSGTGVIDDILTGSYAPSRVPA